MFGNNVKKHSLSLKNNNASVNSESHWWSSWEKKFFLWKICGKKYIREGSQKNHFNLNHIDQGHDEKNFVTCMICGKKFSWEGKMKRHFIKIHEEKKPFNCIFCDYNCAKRGMLEIHLDSIHGKKKPYSCTISNSTYVIRGSTIHLNIQFLTIKNQQVQ